MMVPCGFLRFMVVFCLAVFLLGRAKVLNSGATYTEERSGGFSIEVSDEAIDVAWVDSSGMDVFEVVVLRNGEIDEVRMEMIPYALNVSWCVWGTKGAKEIQRGFHQIEESYATDEPAIVNAGDYVVVTCFSRYSAYALSIMTNITISRTGVVFLSSTLTAEAQEFEMTLIGYFFKLPGNVFGGGKAYVDVMGAVQEVDLPTQIIPNATGPFFQDLTLEGRTVFWMDFSTPLKGLTAVNQNPRLYKTYNILGPSGSQRRTYFSVEWYQTFWGQADMAKGDVKEARVAFYLHGDGGYQPAMDVMSLLVDLAKFWGTYGAWFKSYSDEGARSLAVQAEELAESAQVKISKGDLAAASDDVDRALSLLSQAEEAEKMVVIVRNIATYVLPLIAAVVLIVFVKRRGTKT